MPPRSRLSKPVLRLLWALGCAPFVGPLVVSSPAQAESKEPRYYFHVTEVKAPADVDPALRDEVAKALADDLAGRSQWVSDLGVGEDRRAQANELAARKLRGFDVSVRLHQVKRDLKENRPGVNTKRVGVNVRLEVLGVTFPGEKLAFSGEGDAGGEIEASERRFDGEARLLEKDLLHAAIKQAVDAALLKLSLPASAPQNERRRKKK